MPNTIKIDGFILIYNVDPEISYKENQNLFISSAIRQIEKTKKPAIIVASKCDLLPEKTNITNNIQEMFKEDKAFQCMKIPIVETSALLNVNIVTSILTLFSLNQSSQIKVKSYLEANRTVENRTNKLIDTFSNFILNSPEPLEKYDFEKLLNNKQHTFKIKTVIEIMGMENTKNLFNEFKAKKIAKIKERVLQFCLLKFETCVNDTLKYFEEVDKINNFKCLMDKMKSTPIYEANFEVYDFLIGI